MDYEFEIGEEICAYDYHSYGKIIGRYKVFTSLDGRDFSYTRYIVITEIRVGYKEETYAVMDYISFQIFNASRSIYREKFEEGYQKGLEKSDFLRENDRELRKAYYDNWQAQKKQTKEWEYKYHKLKSHYFPPLLKKFSIKTYLSYFIRQSILPILENEYKDDLSI